jgi:uncharacterized protein YjbI with pentapeptide repeats
MRPEKSAKPKTLPFSDEQIRVKAYQIWQKHSESSPEENWNAAIKALKTEQLFQPFKKLWLWTGFGEKKGWDFLQLLIVPIILVGAGFFLTEFAKERESNQQLSIKEREQKLAIDRAQQETLIKYFEQMSELIKTDDLLKSKPASKTFLIAQIKTVTALQQLNPDRQIAVIEFLRTANLFYSPNAPNGFEVSEKDPKSAFKKDTYGLLYKARMQTTNLQNLDLSNADLRGGDLSGANLRGANLRGANLISARLNDVNLESANLMFARLKSASLNGSNLNKADLYGADLSEAILSCSIPKHFSFNPASLVCAKLRGADLSDANLSGAKLRGADLSNANLMLASLRHADLENANLSGVKFNFLFGLSGLRGANLSGAKLYGVDLGGADLSDTDLKGARFCKTILPNWEVNDSDCKTSK